MAHTQHLAKLREGMAGIENLKWMEFLFFKKSMARLELNIFTSVPDPPRGNKSIIKQQQKQTKNYNYDNP